MQTKNCSCLISGVHGVDLPKLIVFRAIVIEKFFHIISMFDELEEQSCQLRKVSTGLFVIKGEIIINSPFL